MASGNVDQVQVLVEKGAITLFIDLLVNRQNDEIVEQACWALGNIAGDNRALRNLVLNGGAMKPLVKILESAPVESSMVRNVSWAISNLCRGKPAPPFELFECCIEVMCSTAMKN